MIKMSNKQEKLFTAIYKRDKKTVVSLLKRGANAVENQEVPPYVTPLHAAAWTGSVEIAEILLRKGADVNAKSKGGYTALTCAITEHSENHAIVKFLRRHGALR